MNEQTSFYDIDQGQNHIKPLDVPLKLVPPSPADIAEVKQFGRIVNSPEQRKAMDLIADQPTPVIQSQHLRWTSEHAADVQAFASHVPTVRPARHYGEL